MYVAAKWPKKTWHKKFVTKLLRIHINDQSIEPLVHGLDVARKLDT